MWVSFRHLHFIIYILVYDFLSDFHFYDLNAGCVSSYICYVKRVQCDGVGYELIPTEVNMFYKLLVFIYITSTCIFYPFVFFLCIYLKYYSRLGEEKASPGGYKVLWCVFSWRPPLAASKATRRRNVIYTYICLATSE